MESIHVSDVKNLLDQAHKTLCVLLHALETKVLIGEINRPEILVEKKLRKKRTRKVKAVEFPPPTTLPDADENSTFYTKKKREKKDTTEEKP